MFQERFADPTITKEKKLRFQGDYGFEQKIMKPWIKVTSAINCDLYSFYHFKGGNFCQ